MSEGPLKCYVLDIYLTTFPESVISEIQNLWGSSFFSKYSKFNQDFKNAARNSEKVFCFWDNCISIGIVKLSLLRTGYFSSAANVLTSSRKILHVNNRHFSQLNSLGSDHWRWEICCDADFNNAFARVRCCFSKGSLKLDFLDIYLTSCSESLISEIQKLWGSCFFSKGLEFQLDFKKAEKDWGKSFFFTDNCIWIGIVKLSLLRTGYLSLASNVLTISPKIWHVNRRDFFQLNCLGSYQRIC